MTDPATQVAQALTYLIACYDQPGKRIMKIADFESMEDDEKLVFLCRRGVVLIGVRMDGCFMISLFQLENFYVEIYFHASQGCIRNIRCFEETAELSVYLEELDISSLLS